MSDAAAIVVIVAVTIVSVVALLVLRAAARAIASMRRAVEDVHRATIPLLADAHVAVQQAGSDLGRVESLLT
ncbi:MAG TPA: hypothetical protein VM942_03630, partial [Acidimicrobiales bacterium]|nr:hypothetical protein [Acidimicrobiales bacterium]